MYYTQQNQPMINNPYNNGYNPMMNAQQRLQQMEMQYPQYAQQNQFMPQAQQPIGLVGRAVNDFSEIKADDVPMNGTPAIFIKNDMSEIEVRVWGKDGLIRPTSYKPILEQNAVEATNTPQMDLNSLNEDVRALREDILARLDAIEKSVSKPTGARGKKAEVSADERD